MWLRTICLLCVFSTAFSLTAFGYRSRKYEASNALGWSVDKTYKYGFHTEIILTDERIDFAQGYLSMKWTSQNVLVGNVEIMWTIPQDYLLKQEPFTATFNRGQVTDLKVSPDADKWTIELIRALLSQMQISDLVKQQKEFKIMEESVAGKCETYYKLINSNTMTKTKDYINCEKVPMYERGVFGKDNWEAIMKKQDIVNRTTTTEIKFGQETGPQEIKTVERIEMNSENSRVVFQTSTILTSVSTSETVSFPEEDLMSVGGLMYQPKPQKKFCNRNGGLSRNEIETSCEADYYMNPKYFSSLYDESSKVSTVKTLVEQIAKELKNVTEIPKTNTLDRFTVLIGTLRRMNVKELQEVSNLWEFEKSETFIYQSALTLTGTLESLLMIKSLKKNGDLKNDLPINGMPSIVHPLTLEYLDTFFDFATDPEITENDFDSHKDLILDFTNLVRRYMTEKEKPFDMEQLNKLILKKYRKYFSGKLQENLNKDDMKFQVYVRAIGNMADLSLFNYLLSLKPGKLSPFQKTLIVNSMDKTLEIYPAKSQVMLAKLYEDDDEGLSVRIAAMYQLFKTDLPNDMVLDIIREAQDSGDKDIQNAVKTTVMSHAYSYHLNEEISELAEALNTGNIAEEQKRERLSGHKYRDNSDNITKSFTILEYVKSLDENPLSIFFQKIVDRKGFKTDFKLAGMFNNLQEFARNVGSGSRPTPSYSMRGYLEKLRTKLSSANFEMDTDFRQLFIPFENISSASFDYMKFFEKDQQMNDQQLSMEEVEFGFPTEIGFPFLYSYQSPELFYYDISTNVEDTFTMNIHFVWSQRRQTKTGIINPIDGKYYVIGVDMNEQINIPITISYNSFFGTYFVVSIDPLFKEGNQRILHLGTWPYGGRRDIFPLVPTAEDENVTNIKPDNLVTAKEYLDDSDRFLVQATSSKINSTEQATDYFFGGELDAYEYFGPFGEALPTHNMFNIFFKEDKDAPTSLVFQLDLSSDQMVINSVSKPYGKIQGPFLFMGKNIFQATVGLTGPTNRSISVSAQQATDLITQALKISFEGSYSENQTTTYEGCYDILIADQRRMFSRLGESNNGLVVYIQMKGGKSCAEGGMITMETEIDPEKLEKSSKIEAEFTVDFKDIPDEIAVEICKLSDEDYSNVDNVNLKFVQKNEEKCEELKRDENKNVEATTVEVLEVFVDNENDENVETIPTENIEAVEVMWEEASI